MDLKECHGSIHLMSKANLYWKGFLLLLFSPAWDAVQLTLQVGFICPFVVIDPSDLGATIVVAQALCLTIVNLSPTQKNCFFTDGNKASVCVCHWFLCVV